MDVIRIQFRDSDITFTNTPVTSTRTSTIIGVTAEVAIVKDDGVVVGRCC